MEKVLVKLRELMAEKHMTIYKLTGSTHLSESTIYNWYNKGAEPTVHALREICEVLGVSMAELFAEEEDIVYTSQEQQMVSLYRNFPESKRFIIDKLLIEFNS